MDKYRKVMKPKEDIQKTDEEIRVTAAGSVSAYVSRAATVFNELEKPYVIVQATGNALTKAVTAAEVIKRRFKGLHQITELKTVEIIDEYEPLEEGLDKVTDARNVSVIEIKLSKEPLDTTDKGYQPPLDESLVKEFEPEDMVRGRGRGLGKGGRGKGKGRGRG
ncbi:Rpp25l, partial [Symbiodinium sp. KB8]